MNPGERGPAVAETEVAPSPSVNETVDMPSPSMGETLDTPSSVDSKMASGSFTTDAGSGAIEVFARRRNDGRRLGYASPGERPAVEAASGRPCRATRSSRRSAEAAWASSTKPGTSGWIAWSRSK